MVSTRYLTREEKIDLIKDMAKDNDFAAQTLLDMIETNVPRILNDPYMVSSWEINRYNILVRSNIEDRNIQRLLIITR